MVFPSDRICEAYVNPGDTNLGRSPRKKEETSDFVSLFLVLFSHHKTAKEANIKCCVQVKNKTKPAKII